MIRAIPILSIILLAFPILEIYLLILAGQWLGAWVLVWVAASAVAGFYLIRGEQVNFGRRLIGALQGGQAIGPALFASGSTMLAGLLLIFPGPASDALALCLLMLPRPRPQSRAEPVQSGPTVIDGEWRREDKGTDR